MQSHLSEGVDVLEAQVISGTEQHTGIEEDVQPTHTAVDIPNLNQQGEGWMAAGLLDLEQVLCLYLCDWLYL